MMKTTQVWTGRCVPLWLAEWIWDTLLSNCISESMGSNRIEMENAFRGWKKLRKLNVEPG